MGQVADHVEHTPVMEAAKLVCDESGGSRPAIRYAREYWFGPQERLHHLLDRALCAPVAEGIADRRLHQMVPDGHTIFPLTGNRHVELIKFVAAGVGRERILDDDVCRLVVIIR